MTEGLVERINELARKEKNEGLTFEEVEERARLREQYLREFKASLEKNIKSNT